MSVLAARANDGSDGRVTGEYNIKQRGGTTKSVTPTTYGLPFGGFSIALSLLTICILKNVNLQKDESTVYITPYISERNLQPAFGVFTSLTPRP